MKPNMTTNKPLSLSACFLLGSLLLINIGCRKADTSVPFADGKYTGQFYYSSSLGIIYTHLVRPADITFSGGKFTSISGLPPGGVGSYTVLADTAITFNILSVVPPNYDSSFILSGQYHIDHKDDSLILTRNVVSALSKYQFRLKRN